MSNTQEYNEADIEKSGNFAEDFFKNFDKYKEKYKPGTLFTNIRFDILTKRNALDNYILKYYSKLDITKPEEKTMKYNMDIYLNGQYKWFISHPIELLDSPFLKNEETINTYCPNITRVNGGVIESFKQKVQETYKENDIKDFEDLQLLYVKDRNTNNLSLDETNKLMHSLINNIGTDNKEIKGYQEEYLKKLIKQNSKVSELEPKQVEFVAKYISNLMLDSRLKELGYNREDINEHVYIGNYEEELRGMAYKNNIYINGEANFTGIPDLIHTVCHETEHTIQELEASKNPKSKIGLDMAIMATLRNYFTSEKNYNVYDKNYRFEQVEKDAENIGYNYASNYLDMFGFKNEAKQIREIKKEKMDSRQFEYDYRIDENKNKFTREEFIFKNLNNAMAKSPDIINEYPVLSNLYTKEGKVKSFEDIITGDFKINEDEKSGVLEDFCKYYIYKGALNSLDLSKFPEDIQANIASRVIYLFREETDLIWKMNSEENKKNYYKDINKNYKKNVEYFHLKNAKNIMTFMNKNYQHLMKLQDNGKFSSIIDMSYYEGDSKCFNDDRLYEKLEFDDLQKIEDLKQLSVESEENHKIYRINKKRQATFNSNILENSFDAMIADSKLSEFKQATQTIKTLHNENELQTEQEMEEK